jgi:hypothetical protein
MLIARGGNDMDRNTRPKRILPRKRNWARLRLAGVIAIAVFTMWTAVVGAWVTARALVNWLW